MKLVQNDESFLFSSTEIPDIFFTQYLPEAKSEFVKVYFYALFLSKRDSEITNYDLSVALNLDFNIIQDAIKYWEDLGIFIRNPNGYSLANILEIEINKLYSPKISLSPEELEKSAESQHHAQVIEAINDQFFSGNMAQIWYTDIELWFKKYEFDDQVMLTLFNYCYERNSINHAYMQAVAEGWSKSNIKTYSDLDLYFERREKNNIICKDIAKKLNLSRNLTQFEEEYVQNWIENLNYKMDIIELALRQASTKSNINFKYINTILTDWHEKALTTVDEVNAYLNSKSKPKKEKQLKQIAFEYTQSTFDNWDSLYDN